MDLPTVREQLISNAAILQYRINAFVQALNTSSDAKTVASLYSSVKDFVQNVPIETFIQKL